MTQLFDISSLAVNDTTVVDLTHPNGDPLLVPHPETGEKVQVSITIYGPGSKEFQRAQAKRNRAVVAAVRKGANKMKDDDQREIDATFLADCTASFNHFTYGEKPGYAGFKAFYMDPKIGMFAEQVNSALGKWENFYDKAEKN